MEYVPDNYDQFLRREAELDRLRAELPKCDYCGDELAEDEKYYEINGDVICAACLKNYFERRVTI